jgi:hypothetical protein
MSPQPKNTAEGASSAPGGFGVAASSEVELEVHARTEEIFRQTVAYGYDCAAS